MQRVRHPSLKVALAVALALASAGAAALGLGQIEVKSRIGQPLVAEIPIISNDPAELEELRAGLASPETFARIGLQPPRGIVADLQFVPALDAAGRPIIRVTSAAPVTEPLLTFLVEVDWGQGRLVREYSALLDTPRTVSAPFQPPIDAPVISQPDVIERPLPPPPSAVATPTPSPPPPAAEPVRPRPVVATAPPKPLIPAPVSVAPAPSAASEYGPVKAGESLSQIAGQLDGASGFTLEQSMIALLRANPDAFIGGNINQLKQGAVLRIPAATETAGLEAQEAMALVRGQVRQWRDDRRSATQPAPATTDAPAANSSSTTSAPVARRESGARLEIVPPGASRATRAGTQSGITAGGEGKMLRQELQQTKESLAAREAELQELKGRVAELEKLQADQQQLITMKDSELAAAQQRLAASNKGAAATTEPAPAQAPAETTASQAAQSDPQVSTLPWVLGGAFVLALVLVAGGWLLRRRAKATPRFRAPSTTASSASLADTFGPAPPRNPEPITPTAASLPLATSDRVPAGESAEPVPPPVAVAAVKASKPTMPVVPVSGQDDAADTLGNRRERQQLPSGRAEAPAPAWHSGAGKSRSAATSIAEPAASAPGGESLELAQAYLDLGDRDSARQLLSEVLVSGDHAARQQASRMLRELE